MTINSKANRLINATSPYLLQHAHNPVDWYEWGDEALQKATAEDKPILVSIGYSSCHWCHVMERESFENNEIAKIMNDNFVCIKIDREERPDLDQIYMEAVQAMGVNGGWPLNAFLLPDQKPFYGGTYFPPNSWVQVLRGVHQAYQNRHDEIKNSAEELSRALAHSDIDRFRQRVDPLEINQEADAVYSKLSKTFDHQWGGLDKAPKFVMPSVWMLMLRYHYLTKNSEALDHTIKTLHKIQRGGIYDQIGGGFSRYSVDAKWFAPHFEKMLYDNAQLMTLYAEAYSITKNDAFKKTLQETYDWLLREMTSSEGGFYSALDADSEGIEGKFYIWQKDELDRVLGSNADLIGEYYSVKPSGNWEHGSNILFRSLSDEEFLEEKKIERNNWHDILVDSKQKLLHHRANRVRPGLDDKILTAWNAMMITGLVDAAKATGENDYLLAAQRCMSFLMVNLIEDTTIYRSFKNKRSATIGFLDDYAFVIQALIRLYSITFEEKFLLHAKDLVEHTIHHFYDTTDGFFFYTSAQSEKLITRKKEVFDNVIPSSNAVMAQNLFHLGSLFENDDWKTLASRMVNDLGNIIRSEPNYTSYWSIVKWEIERGLHEVMVVGKDNEKLQKEFSTFFEPYCLVLGKETDSSLPLLEDKQSEKARIFVCYNKVCQLPVDTVEEALKLVL